MISVEVELVRIPLKRQDEYFHYMKFNVYGHANDGSINSIKCCAGITAILTGIKPQMIRECILESGKFSYEDERLETNNWDAQTDYALNCALYQLWEVYRMYPSLFTRFDIIEKEGVLETNYERNVKNKLNREKPSGGKLVISASQQGQSNQNS